jgi:PilZ domain
MDGTPPRTQELRKYKRREVHYPVWIVVDPRQPPRQCMLLNVSQGGAKIEIDEQLEPPQQFTLLLTHRGLSTRPCRLVWRNGTNMGVEFLQPPAPTRKFAQAPRIS